MMMVWIKSSSHPEIEFDKSKRRIAERTVQMSQTSTKYQVTAAARVIRAAGPLTKGLLYMLSCFVLLARLAPARSARAEMRLWLCVIAYGFGNLWRRLAPPKGIGDMVADGPQQRMVMIGGQLVKGARYYWRLLAEGHSTRRLFGSMLRRMEATVFAIEANAKMSASRPFGLYCLLVGQSKANFRSKLMMILRIAVAHLLVSSASMLLAQTMVPAKNQAPPSSNEPFIADVHPSPYRSTINYSINIGDQRFDMRDATLLDMISAAYKPQDNIILGDPSWIGFDRFDVTAKVPSLKLPGSSAGQANRQNPYDQVRPALQRVLAERFHLKYHMQDRPQPAYILTVAKDGAKLAEADDPTAASNCHVEQDKANPGQGGFSCTSETIAQFLAMYGGMYFPHPVIDHTGLKKPYDFTFRLSLSQSQTQDDYMRVLTDVFKQQLGLVVAPGDISQPVMVVDSLDRIPTTNLPDIARLIPAQPDLEFEVATIKPAADDEPQTVRPSVSQITFGSWPLQVLLVQAWDLPTGAMLGNAPAWLNQVRYTILVKLPPDIDGRSYYENRDLFHGMLRKLLVDRFQIRYHWGEKTWDGYALLADNPKMKKADPNSRSSCEIGPAKGEKDVTTTPDSPFDNEFHCQNVTMDQFTDVLQSLGRSEVRNHVPNKTGLAGSYDFTLFYTSTSKLRTEIAAADAAKEGGDATTPVQGVSIEDAFRKQLGLRLEKQPMVVPSLVLDHIEQTPTPN